MTRIDHFAIFTDDLETLRAFYVDGFGLKVVADNSKAPVRGYFLADDAGSVLEIIERPPGRPAPETRFACHVAMCVEDYDAAKARLERNGAAFETDTEVNSPSMKTGFFRDPSGNRTQIVQRFKPLGA